MKRVFIILLLVLCPFISEARNIYLVSVGIADYPGTVNDLTLPAKDARAMHRLYLQNGQASSVLITDQNATKGNILTNARNHFAKAKADDIVVFFFSGHGYPGGFVAYDERLPYEEIRSVFSSCRAKNKMIFADACFSGDIREAGHAGRKLNQNVMLFLSSRSDEVSIERADMKNGFFAACLLRALKGGADTNRDRTITARELFRAVSSGVKELSNDRQHPVMWGNFKDDMPVMVW